MIVAIHQPQYLPWLGYFDKMLKADVFCYLDTVQYKKNEWQNRNRIKTAQGWQWLTVPVTYRFPQRIGEVAVDNAQHWAHKHLQALQHQLPPRAAFRALYARVRAGVRPPLGVHRRTEPALDRGPARDAGNRATNRPFALRRSSASEDPTERLIDICRALGGDTYLAGAGRRGLHGP